MTVQTASQLGETLKAIKQQRKDGDLTLAAYYRALLHLVGELTDSLADEVAGMSEEEIALQAPLLLLFLEEQIRKFGARS